MSNEELGQKASFAKDSIISNLLEGTYRFEYFMKPYGDEYEPIPEDTLFQIRNVETLTLEIR
ncbi:MAG: hypothetical protein AAF620_12155 [Bacteroidota bacterium]